MQLVTDLKKMASEVRASGLSSEKATLLVKEAHQVKIAALLTFYKKIK